MKKRRRKGLTSVTRRHALRPLIGYVIHVPPVLLTPVMAAPCIALGLLNNRVKKDAKIDSDWRKDALLGICYPCTLCQARTIQHTQMDQDLVNKQNDEATNLNLYGRKARLGAPTRQMII